MHKYLKVQRFRKCEDSKMNSRLFEATRLSIKLSLVEIETMNVDRRATKYLNITLIWEGNLIIMLSPNICVFIYK